MKVKLWNSVQQSFKKTDSLWHSFFWVVTMFQESLLVPPSEVPLTFQGSVTVSSSRGQAVRNCLTLKMEHIGTPKLLVTKYQTLYRSADKSLAPPTSWCILFDGENISFDASLVIYINSTNIPPNMIINRIYEHQNLLSL